MLIIKLNIIITYWMPIIFIATDNGLAIILLVMFEEREIIFIVEEINEIKLNKHNINKIVNYWITNITYRIS